MASETSPEQSRRLPPRFGQSDDPVGTACSVCGCHQDEPASPAMSAQPGSGVPVEEAAALALKVLAEDTQLSAQSVERLESLWRGFVRFARSQGVGMTPEIDASLARTFVDSRTTRGLPPSLPTRHLRRSGVRLLFRVLREQGQAVGDPTLDLVLPARSSLSTRPLDDDEVELCRWAALSNAAATIRPTVWALAEAGATSSEIPEATVSDLDLGDGRVWLGKGSRTDPRWAELTDWGAVQLARRLRHLGEVPPETRVAYEGQGRPQRRQSATCEAIKFVLTRAGLRFEPGVRPTSVTAWVGRRLFQQSGHIEDVALGLGLRSLDQAASLIGWEWRQQSR